jgi:hypothetical protein
VVIEKKKSKSRHITMNMKSTQLKLDKSSTGQVVHVRNGLALFVATLLMSGCTHLNMNGPLLGSASKDSSAIATERVPPQMVQPICEGCLVDPVVEYVDVVVPECLQPVALVTHRPVCQVCDGYSVSVRSQSGPGKCGEGES